MPAFRLLKVMCLLLSSSMNSMRILRRPVALSASPLPSPCVADPPPGVALERFARLFLPPSSSVSSSFSSPDPVSKMPRSASSSSSWRFALWALLDPPCAVMPASSARPPGSPRVSVPYCVRKTLPLPLVALSEVEPPDMRGVEDDEEVVVVDEMTDAADRSDGSRCAPLY